MHDVLVRLDAQEKELAALRTACASRRRLPGSPKSRKFAVGILVLLVALVPLSIFAANPFTDLAGTVHDPDIDTAYNLGIANGFENPNSPNTRLYYPKQNVTREEMASFLVRTASLSRIAIDSRPSAGPNDNLGAEPEKEYMDVTLNVPGRTGDAAVFVKVSFTGYVFARSSAPIMGPPTLLRGEIRRDGETAGATQIVTRSVVGANPLAIVGAPASGTTPAVAAAERLGFSGSRVFSLPPGTYTFRMFLRREVGTAPDVGFGFGNMQAETIAFGSDSSRETVTP